MDTTTWKQVWDDFYCYWIIPTTVSMAFKWDTFNHFSSRGCITVTCQSWMLKKKTCAGKIESLFTKKIRWRPKYFLCLHLWQVTVLQPLELWWQKVAHLKVPSHINLHLTWKQHSTTFNIYQDILNSVILLHR